MSTQSEMTEKRAYWKQINWIWSQVQSKSWQMKNDQLLRLTSS